MSAQYVLWGHSGGILLVPVCCGSTFTFVADNPASILGHRGKALWVLALLAFPLLLRKGFEAIYANLEKVSLCSLSTPLQRLVVATGFHRLSMEGFSREHLAADAAIFEDFRMVICSLESAKHEVMTQNKTLESCPIVAENVKLIEQILGHTHAHTIRELVVILFQESGGNVRLYIYIDIRTA